MTAAEGTALGLVGVGLADIPLFITALLHTVNQVGNTHGFSHHSPGEQCYVLALLSAACACAQAPVYSARTDGIGYLIDQGLPFGESVQDWTQTASRLLAQRLLPVKTVQGITLLGATGGLWSAGLLQRVADLAQVKYQKRFLYRYAADRERTGELAGL